MKNPSMPFQFCVLLTLFSGCTSPGVGLVDGTLRPCPNSPNCVVSMNGDGKHAIDPIVYQGDRDEAIARIRKIVSDCKGATIVREEEGYIHAEFKTRIMKFVDDVEFLIPHHEQVIHMRSASRVGYGDLGANRKRMEKIRTLFAQSSLGEKSE